jgi:hypothetical protein
MIYKAKSHLKTRPGKHLLLTIITPFLRTPRPLTSVLDFIPYAMAELAAVGLASSIMTFLDVSVQVVHRLGEYHTTAKDAPGVFHQIETELLLINDIVQRTKNECDAVIAATRCKRAMPSSTSAEAKPNNSSLVSAEAAAHLSAVVASCHKRVEQLEALLAKVLPLPSNSRLHRLLETSFSE